MRLSVLAAPALLAFSLSAQSGRGVIGGTIVDPAGALIAGARMEALNTDTGVAYAAAASAFLPRYNCRLPRLE